MAILSIQSHVAYGHVGNSVAGFPLQRMGREVWAVHTVMFAAHAGYGPPAGPIFSPQTVRDVVDGLEGMGKFHLCKAVLSGYLGDAALGEAVLDAVTKVKRVNAEALYCCDPVMGDAAPGLYVRDNIPDFMRNRAIPASDIATPNLFELELLTGQQVMDVDTAVAACRSLLAMGPDLVLLTSLEHDGTANGMIEMMAVTETGAWRVATPKFELDPAPNGAGDLSAALFLANMIETASPPDALGRTASAIHAVFEATRQAGTRELALIAAQDAFVDPSIRFPVTSH